MYRQDPFDRFDFDDNQIGHKKIWTQGILESPSLVQCRNFDLSRYPNIAVLKLHAKCFFVNGLEQPRAKNTMNLDGRPYNFTRQLILSHSAPSAT